MKAIAFAFLVAGIAAASARADGLPVLGVDVGTDGVTVPSADSRYVALPAPTGTLVARIRLVDARVTGMRYVDGSYTIPAVAYDGTAGGLSANGRTLVLLEPRAGFPRARTRVRILDAWTLRTRHKIALRGDYSFDAISPAGTWIYFIHYLSAADPTLYEVRAYDVARARLVPEPIVDPRESGEEMRGAPLTRTSSADGRWAYTLYDGNGKPFVHALDTVSRSARCLELDGLAGRDLTGARLVLDSGSLSVRLRARTLAVVGPSRAVAEESGGSGVPWAPLGAGALVALLGAALASVSARRYRAAG
jgi:hypothetical protein